MKLSATLLLVFLVPLFASIDLKPADSESKISFVIKNFGINVEGEIKGITGKIKWDETNPAAASFNVNVDVKTINTGIDMRDTHLKKEEYFNADKYPLINFTSTSVSTSTVSGNLTIKGITKPVSFPYTVSKSIKGTGFIFEGSFSLDRKDFDIGNSSFSLSNGVTVNLKVKANP